MTTDKIGSEAVSSSFNASVLLKELPNVSVPFVLHANYLHVSSVQSGFILLILD